jgi:hypothetical protein
VQRTAEGIGEAVEVDGMLCTTEGVDEAVEVDGMLRGRRRWRAPGKAVQVKGKAIERRRG